MDARDDEIFTADDRPTDMGRLTGQRSPPISTSAAILQVLTEGPAYGLEIVERVRARTDGAIEILHGSLYPALRALVRDGLVHCWRGDALPHGGRPPVCHALTPQGLKVAEEQRIAILRLVRIM